MQLNRRTLGIAAALLPLSHPPAFAHGDAHDGHGKKLAAKKEQKPWGIAGDAKAVTRTVAITMTDAMRFAPDRLAVRQGETLRLVMRNTGKVMHELVIGTRKDLDEHAALMVKFPGMEHDEPYMAHVAPGKTGEIIWHFNRAGDFDFACLIAGHYQAGMVGKITVTAQAPDMADAEIRKIDRDANKVTLKHGPIKNLDMPPMTMVFQVRDAALLDTLGQFNPGDKVRFSAEQQQGAYVITGVEKP